MTFPEFDKFFDEFVQECRGMRDTKGKEYANSTSRFANFDRLSAALELNRLKIAQVYVQKHLDSLNAYIKTGQVSSSENIRGRIIDIVTYMILIAGMIEDKQDQDSIPKVLPFKIVPFKIGSIYRYIGINCMVWEGRKFKLISANTGSWFGTFEDTLALSRHSIPLDSVELIEDSAS